MNVLYYSIYRGGVASPIRNQYISIGTRHDVGTNEEAIRSYSNNKTQKKDTKQKGRRVVMVGKTKSYKR
jgi:hypothetical protein